MQYIQKASVNGGPCVVTLNKEDVEFLLENLHPEARVMDERKVLDIKESILCGEWNRNSNDEMLVDSEGRLHNGVQRLHAMKLAMKEFPDMEFTVTIRFDVEPNQYDDSGKNRSLEDAARLACGVSYGRNWSHMIRFLYGYFKGNPFNSRKGAKYGKNMPKGNGLHAEGYAYVTECNQVYYEAFMRLNFPKKKDQSREHFRAALFLLIMSGQWKQESIEHLAEIIMNGSSDDRDKAVMKHVSDAENAEGVFKPKSIEYHPSTFELMKKNLRLFIPYLDMLEGKTARIGKISDGDVEKFAIEQIKNFFMPLEVKLNRDKEKLRKQSSKISNIIWTPPVPAERPQRLPDQPAVAATAITVTTPAPATA